MLDYDAEAARYDATRGGRPRALAAATAVDALMPPDPSLVLDLGGGTGAVAAELAVRDRAVVADASIGMLRRAAERLAGRCLRIDAAGLPFQDGAVDAVMCVWLLHLLPAHTVAAVVAETARVLRPGGVLITTVDKHDGDPDSDVTAAVARIAPFRRPASDARETITALAADVGLRPRASASFTGIGQGATPRDTAMSLSRRYPDAPPRSVLDAAVALAGLPDPDRPRPDPVYTLVSLVKD